MKAAYSKENYYRGVKMVPYDLVKELVIALVVVGVLMLGLAFAFSSPDDPPQTIAQWAQADPVDLSTTAANELLGATTSANYGPPYNNNSGSVQSFGPLTPQQWAGVHQPVDAANDYVMQPLTTMSSHDAMLQTALSAYKGASSDQQTKWLNNYVTGLGTATADSSNSVTLPSGDYGPVSTMMSDLVGIGQSGGLDQALTSSKHFFQTDYTKPLLFMGDGTYLAGLAQKDNLTGSLWGMMNETGNYPGQAWLWLYTMWYQVPPFTSTGTPLISAANADLSVVIVMGILSLLLLLVPFIPVLRDIPRWIPIHRLIWRKR